MCNKKKLSSTKMKCVGVLRKCFGIVVKTHYVSLQKVLVIYPGMLGFIKKSVFNSKACFSNYQGAAV